MSAAGDQVEVLVNDQPRLFAAPVSLLGALRELGLSERRGIAVAIGGEVMSRSGWAERSLRSGERILVIQATQGG